jgi:hypothetical protein
MGEGARKKIRIRVGMEPILTQTTCAKVSSILYLPMEKWGYLKSRIEDGERDIIFLSKLFLFVNECRASVFRQ